MFDALVNSRIDTRGLEFSARFFDIEELNSRVIAGRVEISKISYAVLPLISEKYELLDSGSALGFGNGPVLVARPGFEISSHAKIAIPGTHTTANLLLQKLYPQLIDCRPMLFSDIAPAVARGDCDAGVLIHEGRFTYRDHGLELVADLGVEWERTTGGLPLPLGAIVVSKTLPAAITKTIEGLIRESVEYAFAHPAASREFVRRHAQELSDEVIDSHIALFVNEYSLSLGEKGRAAIEELLTPTPPAVG